VRDLFKDVVRKTKDIDDNDAVISDYPYNGKSIDDIIVLLTDVVNKYENVSYINFSFSGSGEIVFYAKDRDEFLMFFSDIFKLCEDYHLCVSSTCMINFTEKTGEPVIKMRFIVPGKLLKGFTAC